MPVLHVCVVCNTANSECADLSYEYSNRGFTVEHGVLCSGTVALGVLCSGTAALREGYPAPPHFICKACLGGGLRGTAGVFRAAAAGTEMGARGNGTFLDSVRSPFSDQVSPAGSMPCGLFMDGCNDCALPERAILRALGEDECLASNTNERSLGSSATVCDSSISHVQDMIQIMKLNIMNEYIVKRGEIAQDAGPKKDPTTQVVQPEPQGTPGPFHAPSVCPSLAAYIRFCS